LNHGRSKPSKTLRSPTKTGLMFVTVAADNLLISSHSQILFQHNKYGKTKACFPMSRIWHLTSTSIDEFKKCGIKHC
jgi:hypothetical protein